MKFNLAGGADVNFIALDFETANADLSSICQVGLVSFSDGEVVEIFTTLIDPNDYFDPFNVSIHGIDESRVVGAPQFEAVYSEIMRRINDAVVVCHTMFDRAALRRASAKHRLNEIACRWLDTTLAVRRTWPKYARSGYGLGNLTREFGIIFNHHDAAEDARATGAILIKVLQDSGLSLDELVTRCDQPLSSRGKITRTGNPSGPLAGEIAVFTGALSMTRNEAADLAARSGCEVDAGVTKETSLLIVGAQDVARLAPGQSKSSKHLKAEALIAKSQPIRILQESDFLQLVEI